MRDVRNHPLKVFSRAKSQGDVVRISGPMVRYSKLPFRETVRAFSPEALVYSPMILAREFVRNKKARDSDFSTLPSDSPLIIQFGTNSETDIKRAAKMVAPYSDGISINCGCPIKEQTREGIGAALMEDPYKVARLVRAVKEELGASFCVEVKIRIHKDIGETVKFAQLLEAAGTDYISVHGRLKSDRSSVPVCLDGIRAVKRGVSCPVVANGDYFSKENLQRIVGETGVDGVMSARGILANPALFAGYSKTPWRAIEFFLDFSTADGLPFKLVQHHLSEMMSTGLAKNCRKELNECKTFPELIDWLDKNFELKRRSDPGFASLDEWPLRYDSNLHLNSIFIETPLTHTSNEGG